MKKIITTLLLLLSLFVTEQATAQLNKNYFYYRGRDYIVEGKYREAIESLNLLLRSESSEWEGYFLRGVAKYNLDDMNGAVSDFTRAIEENPAYTQAFQYRAITRSRMGQYSEALMDFERAIAVRPNVAAVYYSRGVTYFLNRQFERSVADFSQFLKIQPRQPEGYISRGTSHLYLRDTVAAVQDYDRAIKVNPYWTDGYLRRGLLSIMRNRFGDGINDLDRAVELDSTSSMAYFYRGIAKNNIDDIQGALFDFDKAIANDSTSAMAYYNRAIIRSSIGDYNRAIEDYTKIAESNPDNVLVYYNRGAVYAQLGEYDNAIRDYSRAIELYPDFVNAYRYRGQLKAIKGDPKGSRRDIQISNAKIAEYQAKMADSTFSMYADTSRKFDDIVSFDANTPDKNTDFAAIRSNKKNVTLLPLYRFTIAREDTVVQAYSKHHYENRRLSKFINETYIYGLQLLNIPTNLSPEEVEYYDGQNESPQTWNQIFSKGITQSLSSQYNSAMQFWNFAITERPTEPAGYINRAVTQAEMIDFIASLEGNYQTTNIDNDPATRLRQTTSKVKYDYSKAIDDLKRAAELMPEMPHIYYNLGHIMFRSGDMPAAIDYFSRAIELYPYFGEAYYNRGMLLIYINETTKGCMDMSRAGELGVQEAYDVIRRNCLKN